MIEDKFQSTKVYEDKGMQCSDLTCKDCKHEFTVRMDILRPLNCVFDLGRSLTVICPQCKVEAATTEKESRILTLTQQIEKLKTHVDKVMSKIPFETKDREVSLGSPVTTMVCRKCNHEFTVDYSKGINSKVADDTLTVACPLCGVTDKMTRAEMVERIEAIAAMAQLNEMEEALKELQKT